MEVKISIDDLLLNNIDENDLKFKIKELAFQSDNLWCPLTGIGLHGEGIPIKINLQKVAYFIDIFLNEDYFYDKNLSRNTLYRLFDSKYVILPNDNPDQLRLAFDSFDDLVDKLYILLTNLDKFFFEIHDCYIQNNNIERLYFKRENSEDNNYKFIGLDLYSGYIYKSRDLEMHNDFIKIILNSLYKNLYENDKASYTKLSFLNTIKISNLAALKEIEEQKFKKIHI